MTTLATMIALHNELATHFDDVKPIGKFSGSKAAMQTKLDALQARFDAIQAARSNTFKPADLARDLGVNGKVLRAKIRRMRDNPDFPRPVSGNAYHNDDRDTIVNLLYPNG